MSAVQQPGFQPSERFFRPRRLGHANLFVSNYQRSAKFYTEVVGFEEVYRQPDNQASFLSNGNTYHDLALTDIHSKYAAKDQKPGIWHLAFELETEAEMVDGYNRARKADVPFSFVMDHDVARSLYQNDPDGNMVEIYADVEKDWRAMRHGDIIKEKPKWIPGVTSVPLTEPMYPDNPELVKLDNSVFHPKKVTHVALVAQKFDEMFDYYIGTVGLTLFAGGRTAEFAVLKGEASQADVTLYRQSAGLQNGLHHVGFEVWSESDLKESLAELKTKGITVERELDHPARHSVMIRDPDGLRLQFFVNRNWSPDALKSLDKEQALYLL
jgi:catechol 2,3-dioxygenase